MVEDWTFPFKETCLTPYSIVPLFQYSSLYLLNIAVYMPKGRLYIAALK